MVLDQPRAAVGAQVRPDLGKSLRHSRAGRPQRGVCGRALQPKLGGFDDHEVVHTPQTGRGVSGAT